MSETTTTKTIQEELEQRLETLMLTNLREEFELAALYEAAFGADFRGLKPLRDDLLASESVRQIRSKETTIAKLARALGLNRVTLHRWAKGSDTTATDEALASHAHSRLIKKLEELESKEASDV